MKKVIGLVAAAVVLSAGGGAAAWATVDDPPPPNTIVDVSGDKDNGFTIEHYDGHRDYTPTASEAKAECEEYDYRIKRVRCRNEVRVWYRDLRRMRDALDYAHSR